MDDKTKPTEATSLGDLLNNTVSTNDAEVLALVRANYHLQREVRNLEGRIKSMERNAKLEERKHRDRIQEMDSVILQLHERIHRMDKKETRVAQAWLSMRRERDEWKHKAEELQETIESMELDLRVKSSRHDYDYD